MLSKFAGRWVLSVLLSVLVFAVAFSLPSSPVVCVAPLVPRGSGGLGGPAGPGGDPSTPFAGWWAGLTVWEKRVALWLGAVGALLGAAVPAGIWFSNWQNWSKTSMQKDIDARDALIRVQDTVNAALKAELAAVKARLPPPPPPPGAVPLPPSPPPLVLPDPAVSPGAAVPSPLPVGRAPRRRRRDRFRSLFGSSRSGDS